MSNKKATVDIGEAFKSEASKASPLGMGMMTLHLNNCKLWVALTFVLYSFTSLFRLVPTIESLDNLDQNAVLLHIGIIVYNPSRPSFAFLSPYSKVHRLQDQLAPRAHWTQVLESQPRQQPEPAVPPTSRTSQSKAAIAFPLVWRSPSIGRPGLGRWLKHHW